MNPTHRIAIAFFSLAASSPAVVSAQFSEVSPNPAPVGATVVVTTTDTSGNGFSYGCPIAEVRAGSPTGPIIPRNVGCLGVVLQLPANGSLTSTWNQIDARTGRPVPPGRYWIGIRKFQTAPAQLEWYSLDIVQPNTPTPALARHGHAAVGGGVPISVHSPSHPDLPFATLFSFSQSAPILVPGLIDLALSPPLFVVASGSLDANGFAPLLWLPIPNVPGLAFSGFHVQSVIVEPAPSRLVTTNAMPVLIR